MFKFEFMTQTQIGELFGVSSHQVGKWLVEIGLRTMKKHPSSLAFGGDFVSQAPSRNDGCNWVWHSAKTVAALEKAGHRRISNPPSNLAEPPKLNGPFTRTHAFSFQFFKEQRAVQSMRYKTALFRTRKSLTMRHSLPRQFCCQNPLV